MITVAIKEAGLLKSKVIRTLVKFPYKCVYCLFNKIGPRSLCEVMIINIGGSIVLFCLHVRYRDNIKNWRKLPYPGKLPILWTQT